MEQDDIVMDRFDLGIEDDSSDEEEENYDAHDAEFARNRHLNIAEGGVAGAPDMHSYLGSELEVVRGRTVYDEGSVLTLNMLQASDLLLVPGQTLPLTVFDAPTINMLRSCLRNDRTFGVIASWKDGGITIINKFGTTAEIYEYLPEEGSDGFRVKAKIRQRFRLIDTHIADYHMSPWKARVLILPEVQLSDPLSCVKLSSLNHLRSSVCLNQRLRYRRMDSALTRWPTFVYDQYDIDRLRAGIKRELASSFLQQQNDKDTTFKIVIPENPTDLSFWVAQNMPMKEEQKVMLLKLNSPIQRLRWELRSLQQRNRTLRCHYCSNMIGLHSDIFAMTAEGPQSTYVNPGGYLHETITLYKVKGIFSIGPPSTEFSWFPGYAWWICRCKTCKQQIGWKFTSTKSHLKPSKFWGICRRSITVTTHQAPDDDNTQLVF